MLPDRQEARGRSRHRPGGHPDRPLLDKATIHAALGVPELWVFRDDAFTIHALDRASSKYVVVAASGLMPELDFAVLARFATREDTAQALREFESIVQAI